METSNNKTAYKKKLAEVKEKYFPLLEKLIKTEKAEKFQAVYSALNNKRLTIECLLKFEEILKKVDQITKTSATTTTVNYSDTGQERVAAVADENTRQGNGLKPSEITDINAREKEELNTACTTSIKEKLEGLKAVCIPLLQEKSGQYLKVDSQVLDVGPTDKALKSKDSIEEENKDQEEIIYNQKPTNRNGLNVLFSKEKNKKTCKANVENSYIGKKVSNNSLKEKINNNAESLAEIDGTNSLTKVNKKESQYGNLKEINQSSLYCKVRQDKMMLNSQLANMKRGTVFDLADKNNRFKGHFTKPLSSIVLSESQESFTIPTSKQCHKMASKNSHEFTSTLKQSKDEDKLSGSKQKISNFVDNKTYENLKSAVSILGLNANSRYQMTASELNKNEYDTPRNNLSPLSKGPEKCFVPPLPKEPPLLNQPKKCFVPPLPKEPHLSNQPKKCFVPPIPKDPPQQASQEPSTQNVQFSCNISLPTSTNAPTHNWYQNQFQQYQNAPGLNPYQPVVFCGNNSQNSFLPSPFPTHNPYISTHPIPVVCNKADSSYCNQVVPPNPDARCLSCYCTPKTYNQNRTCNRQAHDIPLNTPQTTNISTHSKNPFNSERHASNVNQKLNYYNKIKQDSLYRQRYKHEYSKCYPLGKYEHGEKRPRIDRRDERKYLEWKKTNDCSFIKDRQNLREKYSYPEKVSRKKYGDEKTFGRSKSYSDLHVKKISNGTIEKLETLRTINENNKDRPSRDPRDRSKYFNTNTFNDEKGNEEYFKQNDKDCYISPLENLYESSKDTGVQSVSNKKPTSKQNETKLVKRVLEDTSFKMHNNVSNYETLNNFKNISNLEQADVSSCTTQGKIVKIGNNPIKTIPMKNRNSQNTRTNKCDEEINIIKKCKMDKTIINSNKSHTTETSSTVFDKERKLDNNVLTKEHPNLSNTGINIDKPSNVNHTKNYSNELKIIKPFAVKRKIFDGQTTKLSSNQMIQKRKRDRSTSNTLMCSIESDSDSGIKPVVKRMKYCKALALKKPNEMEQVCQRDQQKSVSELCCVQTEFEVENSNEHSNTESKYILTKKLSALKRCSNKSEVAKKKYVRKRVKVICSGSDSNSDIEGIEHGSPSPAVKKVKQCKKTFLSNFILKTPRKKKDLEIIVPELKTQEENKKSEQGNSKKVIKLVNKASGSKEKNKKNKKKVSDEKKNLKHHSVPLKYSKAVNGNKNQTIDNYDTTESYNPHNVSCINDIDEATINDTILANSQEIVANKADDSIAKGKRTHNKLSTKNKTFTNHSASHKSSKAVHVGIKKTMNDLGKTKYSDYNVSCQRNSNEETTTHLKLVNSSEMEYKQGELLKTNTKYLTDTNRKENTKTPVNDLKEYSSARLNKNCENNDKLEETMNKTSVSEIVSGIDKPTKEPEANLSSNSSGTIRDLFENMKDILKPEAVHALCQFVSLFSNSQENGNIMKRSLENILEDQKSKNENQNKISIESHSTDVSNHTKILSVQSSIGKHSNNNTGNENIVNTNENDVVNSALSKINEQKKAEGEFISEAVQSKGQKDNVCVEKSACQEPVGLNEVFQFTPSNNNNYCKPKKSVIKKRKYTKREFVSNTHDIISNEQYKNAEKKFVKNGTRELDSIHKDLNSLPQYSDIMKSGGIRTCRMKNKCKSGLEENINVKKPRRSLRKTKSIKAVDSYDSSVFPSNSMKSMDNSIQDANIDLKGAQSGIEGVNTSIISNEEVQDGIPNSSDTSNVNTLVMNQEINYTHEGSFGIEIVDVFSLAEEMKVTMKITNKDIKEDHEYVNIAKDVLADFEEDLIDKSHSSVIKHTDSFFQGLDTPSNQNNSQENTNSNSKVLPTPRISNFQENTNSNPKILPTPRISNFQENTNSNSKVLPTPRISNFQENTNSNPKVLPTPRISNFQENTNSNPKVLPTPRISNFQENTNSNQKVLPVPGISTYNPWKDISKTSRLTLQQYWKDPAVYAQMLNTQKLGQFYKCMHSDCAFTSDHEESFVDHLNQHILSDELTSRSRDSWMLCSYCRERLPSVPQYLAHLRLIHGKSKNQCRYCFCRTPTIPEVLAHQAEMHPHEVPHVLQCFLGGTTVDVYLVQQ